MKTPHAATRIQSQFRGFKAREYQTARRKLPIKSRSVYQSYLGSHMIENTLGQEGWAALEQLDLFLPILRELFAKHQGLKIHLSATSKFYMSIGGDDDWAPMKIDGHNDQYHTTNIEDH